MQPSSLVLQLVAGFLILFLGIRLLARQFNQFEGSWPRKLAKASTRTRFHAVTTGASLSVRQVAACYWVYHLLLVGIKLARGKPKKQGEVSG